MSTIQLLPGTRGWNETSPSDWADVLAAFPLFSGIGRRQLRKLVRRASFAEYAPGDFVIQKGEPGNSLHVILAGSARVLGKPASRSLRIGDYFGELSLLDGTPRSATVIATSELHVIKLSRQAFLSLAQDPKVALEMLRTLGSQVRRLEDQPVQS